MVRGKVMTWMNRLIGLALLAGTGLLAAGYTWLHTDRGMVWLAGAIERATDGQVRLSGLSGRLPFVVRADRLTLFDDQQARWLDAEGVEADLNPRALRHRRVAIGTVQAAAITWHDIPMYGATSGENARTWKSRHLSIAEILVDAVTVDALQVATGVMGHAVSGSIDGHLEWRRGGVLLAHLEGSVRWEEWLDADGQAAIVLSNRLLRVEEIDVRRNDDRVHGHLAYDLRNGRLDLNLAASSTDLSPYQPFWYVAVAGDVDGRLALRRADRGAGWEAHVKGRARKLAVKDRGETQGLTLTGRWSQARGEWNYQTDIRGDRVQLQGWDMEQVQLAGGGDRQLHRWQIITRGQSPTGTPFSVDGEASWRPGMEKNTGRIDVHRLQGTWQGRDVALGAEAIIELDAAQQSIRAEDVMVHGITGAVSAVIKDDMLTEADARVMPFSLERAQQLLGRPETGWHGTMTFDGRWSLNGNEPRLDVTATIDDVSAMDPRLEPVRGSRIELGGRLEESRLVGHGVLTHPLLDRLIVGIAWPCHITNRFFPLAPDFEAPVDTRIEAAGRIQPLMSLWRDDASSSDGWFDIDLAINDVLRRPRFAGMVTLTNGQFRNIATDTLLDQVNLRLTGRDEWLVVEQARATDGGRGVITADGRISMDADARPMWDVTATLSNATLFRLVRTDLPLSGTLQAVNTNGQAGLQGVLWLEPFRFVIPRRLPKSVPVLEVTEINRPGQPAAQAAPPPSPQTSGTNEASSAMRFNIEITTRDRLEVEGRGVQTAWKGQLFLRGSTRNPRLVGRVQVASGYAMLLGRRFNIDDGNIQFTGEIPPDPTIYVSASTRIGDTVARLVANGRISRPQVALTSDPLLPSDEVMALILFGKSVETMSPWQAIALANGLRILAGADDLVSVIDSSQSLIKVDQIDIRQDEEGEGFSSLAVGKYIGRRLYVEGEKGFGQAEDSVTVTIELSPRLVLETEASPRIREGVSLYWRREY